MNHGPIIPIDEYHANPAIGKSTLDLIARDPYLVEWSRTAPVDSSKMAALDIGDALHAILLEPARLDSDFAVAQDLDMRTNAGKAARKEFEEANTGRRILSADDHRHLRMMYESVMAHPQARALIEADGMVECSWFWTDEATGLPCKCRPDKLLTSGQMIDIKSTPTLAKFPFAVEDFRYYVQDAWYTHGVAKACEVAADMAFLVVQKTVEAGRYPVAVVRLPEDLRIYGRQCWRRDLDRYARFLEGHGREIQELAMHNRFIDHVLENLEITI